MARIRNKELKACLDQWLDREYWGTKIGGRSGPIAVNTIRSVNFWKNKDGLSRAEKGQLVSTSWSMYFKQEIDHDETLSFSKPLSYQKMLAHFAGDTTVYYTCDPFAKIHNIMLDWDDKGGSHGDTHQAATWLNDTYLKHAYQEPSTSLKGTHQYLFVDVDGIDPSHYKPVYSRFSIAIRALTAKYKFRCANDFDLIKGLPCVLEWFMTDRPGYRSPRYYQIKTGGIFGKLPRLCDEDRISRFLNRPILSWVDFSYLVDQLELDARPVVSVVPTKPPTRWSELSATNWRGLGCIDSIGSGVFEPQNQKQQRLTSKLDELFSSNDKQRVALATVFRFTSLFRRRPGKGDYTTLNGIYNASTTSTGTEMTRKREERFDRAIAFQARQPERKQKPAIVPTEALSVVVGKLNALGVDKDLARMNKKLVRAKLGTLTIERLAEGYLTVRHNIRTPLNETGAVPVTSLTGLMKVSKAAAGSILDLMTKKRWIKQTRKANVFAGKCRTYELLVDFLEI